MEQTCQSYDSVILKYFDYLFIYDDIFNRKAHIIGFSHY